MTDKISVISRPDFPPCCLNSVLSFNTQLYLAVYVNVIFRENYKKELKGTVSHPYMDEDNFFSYQNLQLSYQMCNSSTCRESIIYIIFLQPPYPATMATWPGWPNLEVSHISSVWRLNYSLSSIHLFPVLQRHFPFITLFVCFSFLTLLQISWFILSSLLLYATLPPVLWGVHPAYSHLLLCNFLELFSADIFLDSCLESRKTFYSLEQRVSNGWCGNYQYSLLNTAGDEVFIDSHCTLKIW